MGEAEIDHLRVPANFQFIVNGNRLSQEPACRTIGFCFSFFHRTVVAIFQERGNV